MDIILLLGALGLLLAVGMPIAFALLISSIGFIVLSGAPDVVVLQRMIGGVNSFPLLAVPFFIFAGMLMNSGGITERIFAFANALVGWMRGGLGQVNVAASVIFSGMSGSATADVGGIGSIEIKAMRDAGYDDRFAIGITAASSTIGPLIPPSLPMIIYAVVASESVGKLFAAGVVPGLTIALSLSLTVTIIAHWRRYPRDAAFSLSRLMWALRHSFLALLTPVIVLGGILAGIVTPTEAAIAAVAWVLFLGIAVYRTLPLRALWAVSLQTAEITASVMLIVASATVFAWILTTSHVPELLAAWIISADASPIQVLLMCNVLLLVVGCFLETVAAITILTPVLLPVMIAAGIDPIHIGVIMILNLMIGLMTPPVGMVLFILSKVANVSVEATAAAVLPFFLPLLTALGIVTFVPVLSTGLPELLFAN